MPLIKNVIKKQSEKPLVLCSRCNLYYYRNMSSQKYCTHCGHIVNKLRSYGLKGDWSKNKEYKIVNKHPEGLAGE